MLYLAAVILAFFLAFVLLTKKGKTSADYILCAWMAVTGFHLLGYYLFFNDQGVNYPLVVALGFPLPLAQGPFLYVYTRRQTSPRPFDARLLLHFIPVLLSYLLFAEFYFMSFEEQRQVFINKGAGYEKIITINLAAIYASGIIYIFLTIRRLLNYKKKIVHQFSNTEKINFNWLLYLVSWIIIIWIFVLLGVGDEFIFGAASLFIIWLGYFGLKQVKVFTEPVATVPVKRTVEEEKSLAEPIEIEKTSTVAKYQKSALTERDAELIHRDLLRLMEEEKPFTDPDLTLNSLARQLNIHPNHLSQVINTKEQKSFYDLVNEKRVEEFIRLSEKEDNQQYTLLGLAFDCGFNSKASFNRNFKKYKGHTPSDYLRQKEAEPA